MIKRIEQLLYSLYDTSCFIKDLSSKLFEDYDYFSQVLSCACIEEKYLMKELELALNKYFGLPKRIFGGKFKVKMGDLNWHYSMGLPRFINKSSKEFVMTKHLFEQFKKDTRDIDYFTRQIGMDKYQRLFRIQIQHHDFNSDEWLRNKNIGVMWL